MAVGGLEYLLHLREREIGRVLRCEHLEIRAPHE
jgi:hypothetical protein